MIGGLLTACQWCASAEKPAAPTFTGAPARCHLPTTPLYKCTHRTLFYLFNQIMIELQPGEAEILIMGEPEVPLEIKNDSVTRYLVEKGPDILI